MYIQQLYTNCLAEAAYYIESNGEAAIIDPIRETEPYTKLAEERGAKIKYVFETHFHADFVSGHIDLARKTGATIVFGPKAETGYAVHNATDGELFKLGNITLKVIHTPGHTLESSCYLLIDEKGKEHAIFTGDTLFVGDVGRPDLLGGVMTSEELAAMMYDSLQKKIKVLPDDVIVYPAHGPGSACGKNIGKETWSTIGEQKKSNYALKAIGKDAFIENLVTGLTPPPDYFFIDAKINKEGYQDIEEIMKRNMKPLNPGEFQREMHRKGAIILDTRNADAFEENHVHGAINIGLNGTFAVWVGTIIDVTQPLILITDAGHEEESVLRLARVGYENVIGYLEGGMEAWVGEGHISSEITSLSPEEFLMDMKHSSDIVLDVRKPGEIEVEGAIKNAVKIELSKLDAMLEELNPKRTYLVHCAGGYRSMVACSLMRARGFENVKNIKKGFAGIKQLPGVEIVR